MSQYSWSKRYQIPDVCFKTQKYSNQSKGFDNRLRQTIDTASFKCEDFHIKNDKNKPSFSQTLRHTTDHNMSLTDLLGKSYKFFEPRAAKQKSDPSKNISHQDSGKQIGTTYKNYGSSTHSTWSQSRFKSLKDLKQLEKGHISSFEPRQKIWNSSKFINLTMNEQEIKSPQRKNATQQVDSPYTFLKKNKFFYETPQSKKNNELDEASTKFGSPTNSCEGQAKFSQSLCIKKLSNSPQLKDFAIIKHLGEGRFGAVSMAIHRQSGLLVALKKVKKAVLKAHKLQNQFIMEMKMQLFFKHPNVLKLYGYFHDQENIYLVLEFMEEGTLFNKLKKAKHFTQKQASQKMEDVLHAVKYMHELEIAHRDIKPENIVISNGVCKLCDFGWAAVCDSRRTTLCGTIDYAPPQVLEGKQYGITMDLWCLGVLCYELLVGKAPFYHVSRKQTMNKIINADKSDLKIPHQLSEEAVGFINKMLIKDPQERMHAQQALKHEFIQMNLDKEDEKLRSRNK